MTDPSRPETAEPSTANGVYCNYCGATPAADVDFRAHRGLVLLMQFRKAPGPFCRDCGLATFRRMTGDSLWQGWWGLLSMLINPITILINLVNRGKVAKLPPPLPGAPYLPMAPGKPLYQRPEFAAILLPICALGLLIHGASTAPPSDGRPYSSPAAPLTTRIVPINVPPLNPIQLPTPRRNAVGDAKAGDCLWNKHGRITDDKNPDVETVPCDDPRAQSRILGRTVGGDAESRCLLSYPDFDAYYTVTYTGRLAGVGYTLCLESLN